MRLDILTLTQFRNFQEQSLDLEDASVHLFIGPNGSGKTSLLEGIGMLSLSKSCLGAEEEDIMKWGMSFYRARGNVTSQAGDRATLEIVSQIEPRRQKVYFVNDVREQTSSFVGMFPVVIFLPQDLQLFTGPPAERRRFLDMLLSQLSPEYLSGLLQYQKILKQRNALLRELRADRASAGELLVWDTELAEKGSAITLARLELLETFGMALGDELRSLGESWEQTEIVYERKGQARERITLARELFDLLQASRDRDMLLESTSVGPHRDDIRIDVDGHNLATAASRGQQRIAVLALLFLEASYLELRRGERPVILLDDVLSELDAAHQERVLQSFAEHQVLLTATHLPTFARGAALWDVHAGHIEPSRATLARGGASA